ncbi:hypothetical protein KUCAC02_017003 [Chaenocephalus aceratus]|nr:hypothetical protein KUCAC02_016994 [Chaenocephalus aceratus]KAI4799336.1 hypothetical protein KUCAC02_016997 [Chaenocephalus aceratus]KAI4799342.1 hypothetical protein KUCAC02_017003 [Chaenocephalus aceratus]
MRSDPVAMWRCVLGVEPGLLSLHHLTSADLAATIDTCAYELRQVGDGFYWRYKLLEILLKNYHNVTKIK